MLFGKDLFEFARQILNS